MTKTLIKLTSKILLKLLDKWEKKAKTTPTKVDDVIVSNCIKAVRNMEKELKKNI